MAKGQSWEETLTHKLFLMLMVFSAQVLLETMPAEMKKRLMRP